MSNYLLNGFVLESHDHGEKDVIVTIFSYEKGKTSFIVRGTKKLNSSLRSATEPLIEGSFFLAPRKTLDILTEWNPIDCYRGIKGDLEKLSIAQYVLRFMIEFTQENNGDIYIYNLFKNTLNILQTEYPYDIMRPLFEWGFLMVSGLTPEIGVCSVCGEKCKGNKSGWDIKEGGFVCEKCGGSENRDKFVLDSTALKFAEFINKFARNMVEKSYSMEELESIVNKVEKYRSWPVASVRSFQTALIRFCQFHLREDIPAWLVDLN